MSINKFITNLDLARQAEIMSGETAVFQGGIELGIPFSGFPSGVDTSTIVSLGIVNSEFAAFSGNTGTTVFNVTDPSSPYYSVSATTLSASPYTIIDGGSITETVSATTYPTIMTFTALSGDCCSTPISVSFTPPIIQELYDRGLYDGLFNGLGQASIGTTYIDESFYNVGSVFSGANLNMEIVEYGVHGTTPAWVTGTTSGTVIEYSALTQYWTDPIYESLTSGLTLPITPESADTQTSNYVWTLTDSTIIDENFVGLQYTGYSVTYSFDNVIIDPESPSITGGVTGATSADTYYLGTVTATLENFSAGTLDYKGTTNWLIVNGSATIDERLTTDRMTIHTLGTGSPVTMLAVDINGNVVGGTGGTTDDTGAFTSTTANNTIIPTNAAGNTNDSDYASILGGQNNTISGTSTSSSIVGGENNVVKNVSDYSVILGGEENTISGHTHSFILGGSGNTINFSAFLGDGEGIMASTQSSINGSKNTLIGTSYQSNITGGQLSSILSSKDVSLYFDPNGPDASGNVIIGSLGPNVYISGNSGDIPAYNSIISSKATIMSGGDISEASSIASRGTVSNSALVGMFGTKNGEIYDAGSSALIGTEGSSTISGTSSAVIVAANGSNISNSSHSAIIGGEDNSINGYDNTVILGGQGITSSADDTLYFPNFESIVSNALFYSDYGAGGGPVVRLSAATSNLPRIGVETPGAQGVTFGIRGSSESSFPGYGKQGDVWFYGSDATNGINIINTVGVGKENYIRFFAGQDADGTTPDIFIKGSGSTRGNVGIGTETPTEKLDVNGNVILSGTLNIGTLGGGTSVNNLGVDTSGNVVVGSAGGGVTGSGSPNQVTYWDSTTGITGDNKLTFTPGAGGSIFKIQQSTNNYIQLFPQSASNQLDMVKDGGFCAFNMNGTSGVYGSFISLDTKKDSITSPNPMANGDVIGNIIFGGTYQSGNTNTSTTADFQVTASETWSPTTAGATLKIRTKQNGTLPTASMQTRIELNGNGTNTISGNTIIAGQLKITDVPSGTVLNNLGVDSNGNVIVGTNGGVTIDTYNDVGTTTTINWDVSGTSTNYEVTLNGAGTLNLNNVRNGDYGTIIVEQDGVGSHTLTFGTINGAAGTHKVVNGGGGSPTLTSTPNAIDILSFTYNGTTMYWTVGNDYT